MEHPGSNLLSSIQFKPLDPLLKLLVNPKHINHPGSSKIYTFGKKFGGPK